MSVVELEFSLTPGQQKEIDFLKEIFQKEQIADKIEVLSTPADYYKDYLTTINFKELASHISPVQPLKILDIGVGFGKSSIYLADQGHSVSVLDPSPDACQLIHQVSKRTKLPVTAYCGLAEVANQITERHFDLCIFDSSLHHCDDPVRALKNCLLLLKEKGEVLLVNEPVLKPFRTKKWHSRQLKTRGAQMGDYGGNEHIYYAWEYPRLLEKAGFVSIRCHTPQHLSDPRNIVLTIAKQKMKGEYIYSENKLFFHSNWHFLVSKLMKAPSLAGLLTKSSLIPVTFRAQKPKGRIP